MHSNRYKSLVTRFAISLTVMSLVKVASSEPHLPTSDGMVLEKLRATAFDPGAHEIRELRNRLSADPTNLSLACQYARSCIERSRADADPRFLDGRKQLCHPGGI